MDKFFFEGWDAYQEGQPRLSPYPPSPAASHWEAGWDEAQEAQNYDDCWL